MKLAATPLLILALGAAQLAGAGCDSRGPETPPDPTLAMAPEAPAPSANALPEVPAFPEPGVSEIWRTTNGWTALANRAPRLGVLRQIADAAGFRLEIARNVTPPEGNVTLRAADVAIEAILETLLDGVAYGLHYEPDPETRVRVLTRVALPGRPDTEDPPEPRPADGVPAARPDDETQPTLASLEGLRDPDPEIRAEAAEWISVDRETFSELADLLRNDPSARVRVAAAATLGDAMNKPEEREAAALLLEALHDEEPEVVLAALDALESVGDAGTAPALGFLLQHPTAAVRKAAADTIEWLED